MASLNKSTPVTGNQARDVCNRVVQLVTGSQVQYDWWYNSTTRKSVRTLRVRAFHPQISLILSINQVLAENLAVENYRAIHYTKAHHYSVTVFFKSGTLTPVVPPKFSSHGFCIWRLDPVLWQKHFSNMHFVEFVVAGSDIAGKTDWLYPAFVERVAGPFLSNKRLRAKLAELSGK